jgi:hypothetical protein
LVKDSAFLSKKLDQKYRTKSVKPIPSFSDISGLPLKMELKGVIQPLPGKLFEAI